MLLCGPGLNKLLVASKEPCCPVLYELKDFNYASEYFADSGKDRWSELADVFSHLRPQLQESEQADRIGQPIFDPKATNAALTQLARDHGWRSVRVPPELSPFGVDWDAGKGAVLVEWQFSNYPFLWNNIIRTEAIFHSRAALPGLEQIRALVIVTKSGGFPASNSTLYFEQARAQIDTVTSLRVFKVPIRLVGLTVGHAHSSEIEADWNRYPGRYGRRAQQSEYRRFGVEWGTKLKSYGHRTASLTLLPNQKE